MTYINTDNLVLVLDGETRWFADRDDLVDSLEALGWQQEGRKWVEPENDREIESPYGELCERVDVVEVPEGADDEWGGLVFEAHHGSWDKHWTLGRAW